MNEQVDHVNALRSQITMASFVPMLICAGLEQRRSTVCAVVSRNDIRT